MIRIPVRTIDFRHANPWGIRNGLAETEFSEARLVHAAVTVGHRGMGGLRGLMTPEDWQAEIAWKRTNLHAAAHAAAIPQRSGLRVNRLAKRSSSRVRDGSERCSLSYFLGMTMAAAWARLALGVPWLLHLDVYWECLGMQQPVGERPDLIGLQPDGSWIVVESKGLTRKPSREVQTKAKQQAGQIRNICGHAPALHLAMFTFFAPDPAAAGKPKPEVVNLWAVDPEPEGEPPEHLNLCELTEEQFLRMYYQQWAFLFSGSKYQMEEENGYLWLSVPEAGLRVGVLPAVLEAVQGGRFDELRFALKEAIYAKDAAEGRHSDGIAVEPDESWFGLRASPEGPDE